MNERIRAKEVLVVAPDGEQIGVKDTDEALWLANQLGMDLVEVSSGSNPPVCRLMDYGKYKYEQSVKARESRKKQTRTVIKEVKFKTKIDDHDYNTKTRKAAEFLTEGHKVKAVVMFFGREITHPERGRALLDRMVETLDGVAVVETPPKLEGRNMSMTLLPDKVGLAARAKEAKRLEEARRAEEALSADPEEPDTEEADAKAEDAQGS
ncbi:MAG: translation initiation factor IF-3 [Acidimicrobiia bacterium]